MTRNDSPDSRTQADKWQERIQLARRAAGAPGEMFQMLSRNWPLAKRFARLPWSSDDERAQTLRAFNTKLHQALLEAASTQAHGATKGLAKDLLEANPWMTEHLTSVHQLGCLAPLCDPGTRLDYVRFFHAGLLKLKQELRWSGLGSPSHGISEFGLGKRTGLEVAQSWALLTNVGHLWGTFGTERAVLYLLRNDQTARRELLRAVDQRLQEPARRFLDEGAIHRFFYVLAALRVSRLDRVKDRRLAVALLHAYFDERNRGEQLMWSYRKARQVAYNRMHFYMQAGGAFGKLSSDDVLVELGRRAEIVGDPHLEEDHPLFPVLDAADAHHLETFLTSTSAARLVLGHLREFKVWWDKRRRDGQDLVERLSDLHHRPADWPSEPEGPSLSPVVRLHIPGRGGSWADEVHKWLSNAEAWTSANFLVSPFAHRDALACDVFSAQPLTPATARCIAAQLAAYTEQSWLAASPERALWRSNAVFGVTLLSCAFREVRPALEPVRMNESDRHAGYAILATSNGRAIGHLRELIGKLADKDRRRELEAVAEAAGGDARLGSNEPFLVFLGRLHLLTADGTEAAELDGVWCSFRDDGVHWHVLEHKVEGQPSPDGQLETLRRLLCVPTAAVRSVDPSHGKAALLTFLSPGRDRSSG